MTARTVIHLDAKPPHSIAEISARGAHNLRQRITPNVASERSGLNRVLVGPSAGDLGAVAKAMIGDQKLRKDARLAAEIVLSASPEYFRPAAPGEAGTWDADRLEAWVAANEKWYKDKYKDNIMSAVLHVDETTPHIHLLIVPKKDDGKLCYKEFFDGRAKLRDLHTEYAEAMAPLGLQRGRHDSKATADDQREFSALVTGAAAAARALENPEEDFVPEFIARKRKVLFCNSYMMKEEDLRELCYSVKTQVEARAQKALACLTSEANEIRQNSSALWKRAADKYGPLLDQLAQDLETAYQAKKEDADHYEEILDRYRNDLRQSQHELATEREAHQTTKQEAAAKEHEMQEEIHTQSEKLKKAWNDLRHERENFVALAADIAEVSDGQGLLDVQTKAKQYLRDNPAYQDWQGEPWLHLPSHTASAETPRNGQG